MIFKEALTFDDVLIVPKFSFIDSRREVNLSGFTSNKAFRSFGASLPVISSNMDTVTGPRMAAAMLNYGAQACLHRFCTIEENVKMLEASMVPMGKDEDEFLRPMVSIGLGNEELERAKALYGHGAWNFVIDVAHGAQESVAKQAKALRAIVGQYGGIMIGNFASVDSVKHFLEYTGSDVVDAIKIGVGPGSACTTRIKTGVGYPQLSAIWEISQALKNTEIGIIADGGMKSPGDVAKALGAGAHMAMLGGMLAGTEESPGNLVAIDANFEDATHGECVLEKDGDYVPKEKCADKAVIRWVKLNKKYRGSASQESYESQGKTGNHRTAEGESFLVPYKGYVEDVLHDIEGGLRSSFTYVGARNLKDFHSKVEFVRISNATQLENKSHGLK